MMLQPISTIWVVQTTQIYCLIVLEVRVLQDKRCRQVSVPYRSSGENLLSCLFQFLETSCISWLMSSSSIFKASNVFFFFFLRFSFMWTIFKVFIEFVTTQLLLFMFRFFGHVANLLWDLSSTTRDWTFTLALEGEVLTTGLPWKFPKPVMLGQIFLRLSLWFSGVKKLLCF